MPVTDNFALPYPGPYAPINVTQFQSLAQATDTAMTAQYATVANDQLRPAVYVTATTQAITAGAGTAVSFATFVGWDTTGTQYNTATPTIITETPGLYHVEGLVRMSIVGTITSLRAALIQNGGTTPFSKRTEFQTLLGIPYAMVSGDLFFATPGTMGLQVLWTGTGTGNLTLGWISAVQVADA